jgi:hypothetical protein
MADWNWMWVCRHCGDEGVVPYNVVSSPSPGMGFPMEGYHCEDCGNNDEVAGCVPVGYLPVGDGTPYRTLWDGRTRWCCRGCGFVHRLRRDQDLQGGCESCGLPRGEAMSDRGVWNVPAAYLPLGDDLEVLDPHGNHGRGCDEFGPDEPDCPCRLTEDRWACASSGCGYCVCALVPGYLWVDGGSCV